jgi:circadian clock protein KaiC
MFGGEGYFRGSSVLVSGTAGTGKSSMSAHFVDAACRRGENALYFAFEESPQQIVRNMRSLGLDLGHWVRKGLLTIDAARPSAYGLEMHLVRMHHQLAKLKPRVVAIDPISSLMPGGSEHDVHSLVLRVVDFLKQQGATGFFTALNGDENSQTTSIAISSLVDTWILLRNMEVNGERNRVLYVLKSRGMAHSNQVREFLLTSKGVRLRDVYLGLGGVLTGSARLAQEEQDLLEETRKQRERKHREVAVKVSVRSLEAKIAALQAEKEAGEKELAAVLGEGEAQKNALLSQRDAIRRSRGMIVGSSGKSQQPNGSQGKL